MTEKHTPGPWLEDGYAIVTEDGTTICDLGIADVRMEFEDGQANSRLIAAAPDLLEVCTHLSNIPLTEIHPDYHVWFKAMHAAIAKAEGR